LLLLPDNRVPGQTGSRKQPLCFFFLRCCLFKRVEEQAREGEGSEVTGMIRRSPQRQESKSLHWQPALTFTAQALFFRYCARSHRDYQAPASLAHYQHHRRLSETEFVIASTHHSQLATNRARKTISIFATIIHRHITFYQGLSSKTRLMAVTVEFSTHFRQVVHTHCSNKKLVVIGQIRMAFN
jgi:hypothetical protein